MAQWRLAGSVYGGERGRRGICHVYTPVSRLSARPHGHAPIKVDRTNACPYLPGMCPGMVVSDASSTQVWSSDTGHRLSAGRSRSDEFSIKKEDIRRAVRLFCAGDLLHFRLGTFTDPCELSAWRTANEIRLLQVSARYR